MTQLLLTNLSTFKAYFQNIATQHVDIGGFKWGDKDVLKNDNRSNMPNSILWVVPYDNVKYQGENVDNMMKVKMAHISYFMPAVGTLYSVEESDFDFCELLIEQILARIHRDKKGYQDGADWKLLATVLGSYTSGPVETTIGSTPYRGWELKIELMENTRMVFDANKWTDTL